MISRSGPHTFRRILLLAAPLLTACTATSGEAPPPPAGKTGEHDIYGDAFVDASIGDASILNPVLANDSSSGDINGMVYDGLLRYGPDLNIEGVLAERWEVRRGGREIIFHLRKNAEWHDGKPFTSADVRYTFERLTDPQVRTPYSSDYELVESLTAPDPYTVIVRYKEVFAPAMESWMMSIIPKHVFESNEFACLPTRCRPKPDPPKPAESFNSHPANRCPIGTGPYVFCEWKTDEKVTLTANPRYFEGRPNVEKFVYQIIPDQAVQFLHLRRESIDSMGLRPDQYKAYDVFFSSYNKFRYPAFAYTYFGFNLKNPLFQDLRIRQALAMAINKKELIEGVLLGLGQPATGPFPPLSWAFDPSVEDLPYDPQRAKSLLADAGWRDEDHNGVLDKDGRPFEFVLMTNQGNKVRELTTQVVQLQLKKLGIRVETRLVEWSSFIQKFVEPRAFEAVILGWSLGRDPDQYSIWHSSQDTPGKYNFVGYKNADVDRMLELGRVTFDPEKRKKIYRRIHRVIHDDLPYIFLYYAESTPVVHKRFEGPQVSSIGLFWNFNRWLVPPSRRVYRGLVASE